MVNKRDQPLILVADDNRHNVRMLESILKPEGYDLVVANDGVEALKLVEEASPDLILLDVVMPKMDGLTVLKKLRENGENQGIPVLMVTSLDDLKIKIKGLKAGADDFLRKPFISVELLARVRSLLRIKHLNDELQMKNILLERVLTRYIPEDVASEIMRNPEQNLRLGGVTSEVSVLFADIRGFTNFSEQHSAFQVTDMLNQIFDSLTEPVFEYNGTLDKYLGDAIMAFYGAPLPSDDYAERALHTALAMQDRFTALMDVIPDMEELGLGVGICTGEVIVGNIGSHRLMDYTVIGQTANMAKRLQEHARPGQILIEDQTYHQVAELIQARPVKLPELQHYRQLKQIYEVTLVKDQPGVS
ncbi:MAG: response regulator [Chloroflexi bacterium]|nr:response regulator [Chloroflexota bacterium]